jgi:hypothetical protein
MMVGSPWLLVEGSVEGGQLGRGNTTRQGSLYTPMIEVLRIESEGKRKAPGMDREARNEGIY